MNEIENKHLKGSRKQNCSYVEDYKSRLISKLIKKSQTAQKYVKWGTTTIQQLKYDATTMKELLDNFYKTINYQLTQEKCENIYI